jgi:hypothetical protein
MKVAGSIVASLILIVALGSGGLLHAAVPHSHGDDHSHGGSNDSAMWTDLHSALSHEQKKTLLAVVAVIVVVGLAMVLRAINILASLAYLRRSTFAARVRDPNGGELLRRGIHKYRAFA